MYAYHFDIQEQNGGRKCTERDSGTQTDHYFVKEKLKVKISVWRGGTEGKGQEKKWRGSRRVRIRGKLLEKHGGNVDDGGVKKGGRSGFGV